ncbi:MAG: hypothetical protein IJC86_00100 [Clostridia bacterium]|nr:hypothetical protein [Clostridia bacterium]
MSDNKRPSIYPQEMPAGENKKYDHGVIVDVVQSEIEPKPSQNPAKPHDTDSINSQFAKQAEEYNL